MHLEDNSLSNASIMTILPHSCLFSVGMEECMHARCGSQVPKYLANCGLLLCYYKLYAAVLLLWFVYTFDKIDVALSPSHIHDKNT